MRQIKTVIANLSFVRRRARLVLLRHQTHRGGRMNDDWIVTAYVVIDEVMQALDHRSHAPARTSDAEVLTVAVVAAK